MFFMLANFDMKRFFHLVMDSSWLYGDEWMGKIVFLKRTSSKKLKTMMYLLVERGSGLLSTQ